jgi:hypothetical protein
VYLLDLLTFQTTAGKLTHLVCQEEGLSFPGNWIVSCLEVVQKKKLRFPSSNYLKIKSYSYKL